MNVTIDLPVLCSGYYELYKNGELVGSTKNVLTDGFFTRSTSGLLTSRLVYAFLMVGSGATPATTSDTTLETPLAFGYAGNVDVSNRYIMAGKPICEHIYSYTWNPGAFTGVVSEVGARLHSASSGITASSPVDSRSLVLGGDGLPAPVTVTASDSFTVLWRYRTEWPTTASALLNYNGSSHTVTWEFLGLSYWNGWAAWANSSSYLENFLPRTIINSSTQELINNINSTSLISGTQYTAEYQTSYGGDPGSAYFLLSTWWQVPSAVLSAGLKYSQINKYLGGPNYAQWGLHFDPVITDTSMLTMNIVLKLYGVNATV